ncbi:glucokinase [Candidatus Hakubella thermalkaliphila]|uniref:Glucokinase n=1 Tax=Candidatus Hakubella thermalkaliphila TaxID=2754717 RepID=A0A6V8NMH8_9ACTN|nr:ROK family protein [Candidatus Hakubella thermalkaliphila]GFP21465.1 glucokinase [Candidatus Hakubella thermalkaliphila]
MSGRNYAIGVDIGGINIKTGLVEDSGHILYKRVVQARPEEAVKVILQEVMDLVGEIIKFAEEKGIRFRGIGIGAPGLIDSQEGIIRFLTNFPKWKDVPVGELFNKTFNLPIFIENDVRAAALGEHKFGAGRNKEHLICLAIGTGIGSGIIIDGQLLKGSRQFGGEVGHMTVLPDGPPCACGNRGCLEMMASARSVTRRAMEALSRQEETSLLKVYKEKGAITPEDVAQEASQGDLVSRRIYEETGQWLGIGVASLINIFNPEMVIIGGGVANAGELLLEPVRREVQDRAMPVLRDSVSIVLAELREEAGVIGAASMLF